MPIQTLDSILSEIARGIDDPDNNVYSRASLLQVLNRSLGHYDSEMANHFGRTFAKSKDITHTSTSGELNRVAPYLPRIVSVERTSDDPRSEKYPIVGGWHERHRHILRTSDNAGASGISRYYIENNQIGMLPTETSGTDRVWYALSSPPLFVTEVASISSQALTLYDTASSSLSSSSGGLGTIQLMDDAYNEMNIIRHTGLEVNTITDFDASSLVFTLAFTNENTWAANDRVSILPRIHPEHIDVLVYNAIGKLRSAQDEDVEEAERLEGKAKCSMLRYFANEQEQDNQYIEVTDSEYYVQ